MKRFVSARFSVVLVGVLLAGGAHAQSQTPEDEWGKLPANGNNTPAPPPEDVRPPPLPTLTSPAPIYTSPVPGPLKPRAEVLARIRPIEERNNVSVMGANSLGSLKRGEMVMLGFPLIQLRLLMGLGDRFDLGIGFDSYYFMMNEPRLVSRLTLARSDSFALGLKLEGGYAFFTQRASRESRGARWLSGHRNINVAASVVGSYQGSAPRAARLFFDVTYMLALDTEPYATDPLVGVPPSVIPGHNVLIKGGAELPLSSKTAFVLSFGFDVHGRSTDSVVMPNAGLGLVTSL